MSKPKRVELDGGNIVLWRGDCMEILPSMEPGSVDAVVTDPPYGVGFRGQKWDACIPEVATKLPSMFVVVAIITAPTTMWDYPGPDLVLNWCRPGSTSRTKSGTFNHWSPVLLYGAKGPNPDTIVLPGCGYPGQNIGHPSPKPLRLMEWIIRPMPGEVVCDPFCGSGTTAVACVRTGRRFIGMELDENYFKIAVDRVQKELDQRDGSGPLMRAQQRLIPKESK